eukprot:12008607-Alexandrium_andersonii.AAC.1
MKARGTSGSWVWALWLGGSDCGGFQAPEGTVRPFGEAYRPTSSSRAVAPDPIISYPRGRFAP